MKNLIFKLFLGVTVIFYSCSNEGSLNQESSNEIVELKSSTFNENQVLIIESEELPMLSNSQARMIGYENLVNDAERTATLDIKSNILSVPFNKTESIKSQSRDSSLGLCIRIVIAKLNPSTNCPNSCTECIGFRCGFITFPCLINRNTENSNRNPSQEREQTADVIVNESNQVIEYQFHNEIDWEYLANN